MSLSTNPSRRRYGFAFLGITIHLASNTAFAILTLSDQHAVATTDAMRSILVVGGEAMLAIYQSIVIDVGLFLLLGAVFLISVIMLRNDYFGRSTAYTGLITGVVTLGYYISSAFTPLAIFILKREGLFFMAWIILVGRRLLQLGNGKPVRKRF